ncbi:MAG: hypothetical protein CMN30_18455 [Sandaracinus sp.]|nr:hypothetical protein [Sandaracinus sp.]
MPVTQGRRVHERYDCDLPVTVVTGEGELETRATNVSLGGMYLITAEQVPFGTTVKVRFRVPSLKDDALIEAVVRWAKPDGFGVQFGRLRALEVWALNQYFKSLDVQPED